MVCNNSLQCFSRWRNVIISLLAKLVAVLIVLFPLVNPTSANRCLALSTFTIIMLVFNPIPLYATAFLVPVLVVSGSVLRDASGTPLPAKLAARRIVGSMFGAIIPILLASFTIAACFRKYNVLGHFLINKKRPKLLNQMPWLVGSLVFGTLSLCFFLPNISSVLIISSLMDNIIIEAEIKDIQRAIVLSIAIGGSIGGFLTPISSPQSMFVFTLGSDFLQLTWWQWLAVSIPCVTLISIFAWPLIAIVCRVTKAELVVKPESDIENSPENHAPSVEGEEQALNDTPEASYATNSMSEVVPLRRLIVVLIIAILTILLWSFTPLMASWIGDMAIVSFIPMVIIFAFGILDLSDLARLPWDLIMVVMGLLALVEAAKSSGLLTVVVASIVNQLRVLGIWSNIAISCLVIFIFSTFTTHTISGLIAAPLIIIYAQMSGSLSSSNLQAFYLTTGFTTSIGMTFPFSSMVNLAMFGTNDAQGQRILSRLDFVKVGLPISILCYLLIISLGTVISLHI